MPHACYKPLSINLSERPLSRTEIVPTKTRSRSNTAVSNKSRKRSQSRASTTSAHSVATQSALDQHLADSSEYPKQWIGHGVKAQRHQQRFASVDHQLTPEDLLMHSASQIQNSRESGIDPNLGAVHLMGYQQQDIQYKPENPSHSIPAEIYSASFGEEDSQILEGRSDEQDDGDSVAGLNEAPKKASKSSAANEMEMRQLFNTNKQRTLPEVASELHGNERGPHSERTRQVFAMLW